jgi:hypothetical protein
MEGQKSFFVWSFALTAGVVITVSVDVWEVAPLSVTDRGVRLQVGMSFTSLIEVLTLQVRLTVPLNPFLPTTLTVPVFPVFEPGVTVIDVVPPVPAVKLGGGVMLSERLVVAARVPELAVMATVTGFDVNPVRDRLLVFRRDAHSHARK